MHKIKMGILTSINWWYRQSKTKM